MDQQSDAGINDQLRALKANREKLQEAVHIRKRVHADLEDVRARLDHIKAKQDQVHRSLTEWLPVIYNDHK